MPMLRRSGGSAVISTPSKRICPASGSTKPAIERSVVVLPQPLGPSSDTSSPSPISMLRSSTAAAAVSPYLFVNPLILTVVIATHTSRRRGAGADVASGHFLVPPVDDRVAVLVGGVPVEDDDLLGSVAIKRDQRLQIVWDLGDPVRWRHIEPFDQFLLDIGAQQEVDPFVAFGLLLAALQHVEHLVEHEAAFGWRFDVDLGAFPLES